MTWSPLACGIISGKYGNGVPESSRASLKVFPSTSRKESGDGRQGCREGEKMDQKAVQLPMASSSRTVWSWPGDVPGAGSPEPRALSLPEACAPGQASVSPSQSAGTDTCPPLGPGGNAQRPGGTPGAQIPTLVFILMLKRGISFLPSN